MADFAKTIAEAYATTGATVDLGRGVHDGGSSPRPSCRAAADAQPARPDRGRYRHRQDADAAGSSPSSSRPPASRSSPPTTRATSRGSPTPGAADGPAPERMQELGLAVRADRRSRSSSCRSAASAPACRCAPRVTDFGPQLLAKVLEANETQESSLALVFRYADEKRPAAARPRRPARAADLPRLGRGQGRAEGHRRRLRRRRSACCCARSSRSRTAAATSSSASRSSRIADLLRTAPDGRGDHLVPRARRPCRTSRSSSRPS